MTLYSLDDHKSRHKETRMAKKMGLIKHQKRQHRRGEDRLPGSEVEYCLGMADCPDSKERVIAMGYFSPCHVRRRIDPVWDALYRRLQNPNLKVREAAWHTLDDGGRPNDLALQPILENVAKQETHPKRRQRALDSIRPPKRGARRRIPRVEAALFYGQM